MLLAAHAAAYDRYLRYQMIAVIFRGEIAACEHQELLEAVLVRDWKRAQSIMVSHIRGCIEHAMKEDNAGVFGNLAKPALPNATKTAPDAQSAAKVASQAAKPTASTRRSNK